MITIKMPNGKKSIKVFTKYSEITPEYLKKISKHITLGEHQSLVAVCAKISLYELTYIQSKKNNPLATLCLFVKSGTNEGMFSDENCGKDAIIANSALEYGIHVTNTTFSSATKLATLFSTDMELANEVRSNTDYKINGQSIKGAFIAFKVVGNNSIAGIIDNDKLEDDEMFIDEESSKE